MHFTTKEIIVCKGRAIAFFLFLGFGKAKCELQIKCDESTSGKADRHERTVLLRLHRRCMGGLLYFTVWAGPASVLYRVQPAPVRYRL